MSRLFSPFTIRGETIPNRVFVSPMCQYSCEDMDGKFSSWHVVHLGSRAVGGAGLVMAEATAVQPEGRISPWDTGIWSDDQIEPLGSVVEAISTNGAIPAIQLAHAGQRHHMIDRGTEEDSLIELGQVGILSVLVLFHLTKIQPPLLNLPRIK